MSNRRNEEKSNLEPLAPAPTVPNEILNGGITEREYMQWAKSYEACMQKAIDLLDAKVKQLQHLDKSESQGKKDKIQVLTDLHQFLSLKKSALVTAIEQGQREMELGRTVGLNQPSSIIHQHILVQSEAALAKIREIKANPIVNSHRRFFGSLLDTLARILTLTMKKYRTDTKEHLDNIENSIAKASDGTTYFKKPLMK